jgi:hypothetical protein
MMMGTTMTAPATVEQLRERVREYEAQAKELREQADRLEARARKTRVEAARLENGRPLPAPTTPTSEIKLRDFAMNNDVFSEAVAIDHLGMPKAKFRTLADRLVAEGKLAAIGAVSNRSYAWIRPDHDASAPAKRAFPEAASALPPRRRGDSVTGTGKRKKATGDRNVRQLTGQLEKQGATVEKMGNGHLRIRNEDGDVITMSATPRKGGLSKTKSQARNRLGYKAA